MQRRLYALIFLLGVVDTLFAFTWIQRASGKIRPTSSSLSMTALGSSVANFSKFLQSDVKTKELIDQSSELVYLIDESSAVDESMRRKCRYDLFVPSDPSEWPATSSQLSSLLQRIQRASPPSLEDTLLDAGEWSHFVSLTFPSIDQAAPSLALLRIGADAWELRVDLLEDISIPSLHRQISLLRRVSPLPIVFTVRSEGQIGKFPPNPERIFELLQEGLRAGCEWIDVEACWPIEMIDAFTSLAMRDYSLTSRLLGSLHATSPKTETEVRDMFAACSLGGKAHMLKVVTGATSDEDCRLVHRCGEETKLPYIALCLGAAGSLSRVLNRRFTPVTHPLMATAAPGQLSVAELMARRIERNLLSAKEYFLFGTPIQQSMSPAMHNAAYRALLLPHHYSLAEEADVSAYEKRLSDESFGGASVTIPHKETVGRYLQKLSPAAEAIGAVNTIIKLENEELVGDNTDYLGIKLPISRLLRRTGGRGLVVGAGIVMLQADC